MYKKILLGLVSTFLLVGCSSKSENMSKYSVTEATDYAMGCNALLHEIKVIKAKVINDENFLESFVPNYLLNKEDLTEQDILVLRERKKSLQLIYTIKQSKNECRALTVNDTKVDGKIVSTIKDVKNTVTEVSNEIAK